MAIGAILACLVCVYLGFSMSGSLADSSIDMKEFNQGDLELTILGMESTLK